ncbi:hypothetical protein OJAV_G00157670 [Oryzias javanicus]|uniref:Uncharacterized protein n=1 Tax=Oryzias javanicus TaxID=123683 RepID=A0A3S2PJE0_ORYJA|nr:hypothetical protein OJAV_G00157670 [Oryzias javanicus]
MPLGNSLPNSRHNYGCLVTSTMIKSERQILCRDHRLAPDVTLSQRERARLIICRDGASVASFFSCILHTNFRHKEEDQPAWHAENLRETESRKIWIRNLCY